MAARIHQLLALVDEGEVEIGDDDAFARSNRFRVIASNNDGVWNEEGASLDVVIAPAWYQTTWFLVLSFATAGAVLWAAYRLRLRQVAAVLNARFDERLAERTRVARDLHDTLLQT